MSQPTRVLIVVDEPNVARPLARALGLASESRYAVDVCTCAEAGLAKLAEHPCDIVLTDIELPDMNGLDFLMRVREISPRTRSILMAGRGALRALSGDCAPAEGYLVKPFGLKDFLQLVEQLRPDPGITAA